jgi:hypothetical protein
MAFAWPATHGPMGLPCARARAPSPGPRPDFSEVFLPRAFQPEPLNSLIGWSAFARAPVIGGGVL